MAKIFITGGDGFIGHHLTKLLLQNGHEVVTYDIQTHSIPFAKSTWPEYILFRTNDMANKPGLTRIRGDVSDRGRLKSAIVEHQPEYLIHLAALPIAGVSNDYPEEAHRNILNTTITLMDAIKELPNMLKRLVWISSSMVYGNFNRDENDNIIAAREDDQCDPIDIYGAMKLGGEHIVRAFSYRFGIPYSIVRPSAVYGPTDCNRRVTEIFLMNALAGKPLLIDNGGTHQLDLTYVDDLVQGIHLVMDSEAALGETFNITRGEGRSILELAQAIKELVPGTVIEDRTIEVYRPNRGALDISKARKLLGYNPQISMHEGMEKYLAFVQAWQAESQK